MSSHSSDRVAHHKRVARHHPSIHPSTYRSCRHNATNPALNINDQVRVFLSLSLPHTPLPWSPSSSHHHHHHHGIASQCIYFLTTTTTKQQQQHRGKGDHTQLAPPSVNMRYTRALCADWLFHCITSLPPTTTTTTTTTRRHTPTTTQEKGGKLL